MKSKKLSPSDVDQAIVHLQDVQSRLHERLATVSLEAQNTDRGVNSIALIVRTLEKIDQLLKSHAGARDADDDALSKEDYDKLKGKVKNLIQKAIDRGAVDQEAEDG